MHTEKFIADARSLADFHPALVATRFVAIDTEFVRERTYYPVPCLIQIAAEDWAVCVDCMSSLDLRAMLATLLTPERAWILHSARQDLEIIWNLTQAMPARVIDVQIAAAMLGFPPQIGLQTLLENLLGIKLDKAHTRTDWSARPLAPAAVAYAFDDVRFLHRAWHELETRLLARGRLAWFEEDCLELLSDPPVADLPAIFQRLKGIAALPLRAQCAALALLEWRERRARESDRPRRWILADEHVLAICRALPRNAKELEAIRELQRGIVSRSGAEIIAAIASSDSAERRDAVQSLYMDRKADKNAVASLQDVVRERASALGIHAEVLATRKDVTAIAAGARPQDVLSAWRVRELGLASRGETPLLSKT